MYISCNDILIGSLFYKGVWVWGKLFLTLKLFVQVLGMQFELQFVLLFLLLFTEISGLCNIYSAIHKATGSLVTGCSQKTTGQNAPSEAIPAGSSHWQPMDTFLFHRNYTSGNHGTAENSEAGGFVNSAVSLSSKKPLDITKRQFDFNVDVSKSIFQLVS